ncbi:cytochrome c biogenesis CcdA family protein [Haloplanus aerogenes]|uniref:Cytochrome c biogenesis protein CcdA n=1 Tax=Haloplanus aerogenes TaxID=660522 RepID=A0A3M0D9Q3_9EURY|nr:cytochrome c biogenesis CcdA family protein [Haloplanus aerogenes]AZH26372.1 cytochrome c biogenesis protein CcdA [Haloplanus aerogenes]RMB18164.1 cytochrome c biogenesis transmembrane protein [Haloplanus aerogenes]
MIETPSTVAVFLAGVVTILTPCCLPMIPVLVVGANGHRLRPVAIVAGSTLTFTALGTLTASLGAVTPETIRAPFAVLMLVFGVVLADDDVNDLYTTYASRLAGRATALTGRVDEDRHPIANAFVVGLLLGIIWLPCVGPILGGVLAYVGSSASVAGGAALLFTYGVGFSIPLLGVAYAGRIGGHRLVDSASTASFRTATGYAFVLLGLAVLFDVDKLALASVTNLS